MSLKNLVYSAAMVAVAAIVGCSTAGLPEAKTFNERAAVAYGTVTAVRNTTTELLVSKKITNQDARNVQDQADLARAGIDTAVSVHTSDPNGAESRLTTATTILQALQSFLQLRSAK
jgi:hypothetical protein